MMEGVVMNQRTFFEKLYADYPDLVSLNDLQAMLGGISQGRALKLVKQGAVKSFYVHGKFMIPKICIIDYLMGNSESAMKVEAIHQNKGKDESQAPAVYTKSMTTYGRESIPLEMPTENESPKMCMPKQEPNARESLVR